MKKDTDNLDKQNKYSIMILKGLITTRRINNYWKD